MRQKRRDIVKKVKKALKSVKVDNLKNVNLTQMVGLTGLGRQSIYNRVRDGILHREKSGLFPLGHPVNKAFLKSLGLDPLKINPQKPRAAGRPVSSDTTDPRRGEIYRVKKIHEILHLQEVNHALQRKYISADFLKNCLDELARIDGAEHDLFTADLCRSLPPVFDIKRPGKALLGKLREVIGGEVELILSHKKALIQKFWRTMRPGRARKAEECEKRLADIPAHLRELAAQELDYSILSTLSKKELDQLKVVLQVDALGVKTAIKRREILDIIMIRSLFGDLFALERSRFCEIAWRIGPDILPLFAPHHRAETQLRAAGVIEARAYQCQAAVKEKFTQYLEGLK